MSSVYLGAWLACGVVAYAWCAYRLHGTTDGIPIAMRVRLGAAVIALGPLAFVGVLVVEGIHQWSKRR